LRDTVAKTPDGPGSRGPVNTVIEARVTTRSSNSVAGRGHHERVLARRETFEDETGPCLMESRTGREAAGLARRSSESVHRLTRTQPNRAARQSGATRSAHRPAGRSATGTALAKPVAERAVSQMDIRESKGPEGPSRQRRRRDRRGVETEQGRTARAATAGARGLRRQGTSTCGKDSAEERLGGVVEAEPERSADQG
jgi:hypothetical protein